MHSGCSGEEDTSRVTGAALELPHNEAASEAPRGRCGTSVPVASLSTAPASWDAAWRAAMLSWVHEAVDNPVALGNGARIGGMPTCCLVFTVAGVIDV